MPHARTHKWSPAVPELTPMAFWLPVYALRLSSKAVIWLPILRLGVSSTLATAWRSSSVRSGDDIEMGGSVGGFSGEIMRSVGYPYLGGLFYKYDYSGQ